MEKKTSTLLTQSAFTISPKIDNRVQGHMLHEASWEIIRMDCDVLTLWSTSDILHRSLAPSQGCVLMQKYWRSVTTSKCYRRTQYFILTQMRRHHCCHHKPLHTVLIKFVAYDRQHCKLELAICHTLYCRYCCLAARLFYSSGQFYIKNLPPTSMFEVGDGNSTTGYVLEKHCHSLECRPQSQSPS